MILILCILELLILALNHNNTLLLSPIKFLELSRTPQRKRICPMKLLTASKALAINSTATQKLFFALFLGIFAVFFDAYLNLDAPKECKNYCQTIEKLPSEQAYFSGIDHYQERFPERVKRYNELKKNEANIKF